MADLDKSGDATEARRHEELAKTLAQLSDDKRQKYETQLANAIERHGQASYEFKLGVAKTYAQGLPANAEARQINEHRDREYHRAFQREQRPERERSNGSNQSERSDPASTRQPQPNEQGRANPAASLPHAPPYAELNRTHEKVAANALSAEQLQGMADRYAKFRKDKKLEPTLTDRRERETLDRMQTQDRERVTQAHGANPTTEQRRERELLDRQHLAERVGAEARSIGRELRRQGMPGAESFEQDSRRLHETARLVHAQRQRLEPALDRGQELARTSREQQDQQRKTEAQEAKVGNRTLTSEQRANASPEVKQTLDRQERADAVRRTGVEQGFKGAQKEVTQPGNVRSGGRSR